MANEWDDIDQGRAASASGASTAGGVAASLNDSPSADSAARRPPAGLDVDHAHARTVRNVPLGVGVD